MALSKNNRIKKRSDFEAVYKKGRSRSGELLFIKVKKGSKGQSRVGFIVPQKIIPSAVARNRIKRTLSDAVRKELDLDSLGADVVLYIKKKPVSMESLKSDAVSLLKTIDKD